MEDPCLTVVRTWELKLRLIGTPCHESDGLASLFRCTKHACTYAVTTPDPIATIVIVDSVLKCIMENPYYSDVYFCFKGLDDQTYLSLMKHFKTAEWHMNEVKDMAPYHGFGGGTIEK